MSISSHGLGIIEGVAQQFAGILNHSDQAVYIYLSDELKVCNKNFSDLLGYESPEEWARIETSFPQTFVDDASQKDLVMTYQNAMNKMAGSQKTIVWKKKNGTKVKTEVILVPIAFEDHLLALHFISKK